MKISSLSVGKKLALGFSILIILVTLSSILSLVLNSRVRTVMEDIFNRDVQERVLAAEILATIQELNLAKQNYLNEQSETNANRLHQVFGELNAELEYLKSYEEDAMLIGKINYQLEELSITESLFAQLEVLSAEIGVTSEEGLRKTLSYAAESVQSVIDNQGLPDLSILIVQSRQFEKDYMLYGDPMIFEKIDQKHSEFREIMELYAFDETLQNETNALWKQYINSLNAFADAQAEQTDKGEVFSGRLLELGVGIQELADSVDAKLITAEEHTIAASTQIFWILASVPVVCLIVGLIVAYLVLRSIKRPLDELKIISEREGDLSVELKVLSGCEIGDLSRFFNRFVGNLRQTMEGIVQECNYLHVNAEDLTRSSTHIKTNVGDIAEKSDFCLQATKNLTENLFGMSNDATNVASGIESVSVSVNEINLSLQEIARNCNHGHEIATHADNQVVQATDSIDKLNKSAYSVSKVVEVIQSISDQINLLSLNATIEAASAGEAGRGFAVVASEVKALANQTAEFTDQIRQQINQMQLDADEGVSSIKEILEIISDVKDTTQSISASVEEQTMATSELSKNTDMSSEAINNILNVIKHSSENAENTLANIELLNVALEESTHGIHSSHANAKELSEMAGRLRELVSQFKLKAA